MFWAENFFLGNFYLSLIHFENKRLNKKVITDQGTLG
jgi:hypothetical protein